MQPGAPFGGFTLQLAGAIKDISFSPLTSSLPGSLRTKHNSLPHFTKRSVHLNRVIELSEGDPPMNNSKKLFLSLLQDESGQDLIEYALVAGLVGLAAVGAMSGLSTKISNAFNSVGSSLTSSV
jgi:pilus assembly protein Flp/PilA